MTKYRVIAQRYGYYEQARCIASYNWQWMARIHSLMCQFGVTYCMAFIVEDNLADPL